MVDKVGAFRYKVLEKSDGASVLYELNTEENGNLRVRWLQDAAVRFFDQVRLRNGMAELYDPLR